MGFDPWVRPVLGSPECRTALARLNVMLGQPPFECGACPLGVWASASLGPCLVANVSDATASKRRCLRRAGWITPRGEPLEPQAILYLTACDGGHELHPDDAARAVEALVRCADVDARVAEALQAPGV